jgi:hypothetical protein
MDCSTNKAMKQVEMDYPLTTPEPVEPAKTTEVIIQSALPIVQIALRLILTSLKVSLQ